MRVLRFRFTLRRMMVGVAVVGIILASINMQRRRRALLWRAEFEGDVATLLQSNRRHGAAPTELIHYHSALQAKYAGATRYPWLPVAPDPPEPK